MKVYLVNKNPIIAKLVALSASKAHLELIQSENIEAEKEAGILLVDDESYNEELFLAYKQAHGDIKSAFFYSKSGERVEGFNEYIQKPFLPTDLFNILNSFTGGFEFAKENLLDAIENDKSNKEEYEDIIEADKKVDQDGADFSKSDFIAQDDIGEAVSNNEGVLDLDEINTLKDLLDEEPQKDLQEDIKDSFENNNSDITDLSLGDFGIEEGDKVEHKEQINEDFDLEGLLEDSNKTQAKEEIIENIKEATEDNQVIIGDIKDHLNKEEEELAEFGFEESAKEETQEHKEKLEELLEGIDSFEEEKEENSIEEDLLKNKENEANIQEDVDLQDLLNQEEILPKIQEQEDSEEEKENKDEFGEFNLDVLDDLPLQSEDAQEKEQETLEELKEDHTLGLEEMGGIEGLEEDLLKNKENEANIQEDVDLQDLLNQEEILPKIQDQEKINDEAKEEIVLDEDCENKEKPIKADTKEEEDDFATLSLEGMSEALGEPIAKEPNITPIVPQNEEKKISGDLQVNSIESLMVALQSLQTQGLKELLSGATINISIQFPKKEQE